MNTVANFYQPIHSSKPYVSITSFRQSSIFGLGTVENQRIVTWLSHCQWSSKLTSLAYSNEAYGWHFQYLTIIGLSLATITFSLGLIADFTLSRHLFLMKNILSCCSAPMETLISTLYWGLRAIDPELVVPKELELPIQTDLSFHLIPTLMLLVDLLLLSPPWTISTLPALVLSTSIAFAYWFWIELCYSKNGFYPYPLFVILDTTQRAGLFLGSAIVMTLSTVILKWLYGRVNGVEDESQPGHIRKMQ